jgi:hypothetical protein
VSEKDSDKKQATSIKTHEDLANQKVENETAA